MRIYLFSISISLSYLITNILLTQFLCYHFHYDKPKHRSTPQHHPPQHEQSAR